LAWGIFGLSGVSYYGAFYPSALYPVLRRINTYRLRWIMKKYKKHSTWKKAIRKLADAAAAKPRYFAHWAWVNRPLDDQDGKSRVTGDCYARICGGLGLSEIPPGYPTLRRSVAGNVVGGGGPPVRRGLM
jgi:hypothetical protein